MENIDELLAAADLTTQASIQALAKACTQLNRRVTQNEHSLDALEERMNEATRAGKASPSPDQTTP